MDKKRIFENEIFSMMLSRDYMMEQVGSYNTLEDPRTCATPLLASMS